MAESGRQRRTIDRDGTSQRDRKLAALDPNYVLVDERSVQDVLAFAREYAAELKYFGEDDREQGDWRAFMDDVELEEVVAFIDDPDSIPEARAARYRRPHFVLFLTFLQLLESAKDHLNTLTRRHLDFYYRDFLRLKKKPARPDRVNVWVELANNQASYELPAGTLLDAGKDSTGQDLAYRTEEGIVVSQARIAHVRSVFVDKRIIGLREAFTDRERDRPFAERFLDMLKIALGHPEPGDELPDYDNRGTRFPKTIDYSRLHDLADLVEFVATGMFMGFADFEDLMKFKRRRSPADDDEEAIRVLDAEWDAINGILREAGEARARALDEAFDFSPRNPRDFDANFEQALKFKPYEASEFNGIRDVGNINELYRQLARKEVQDDLDNRKFFKEKLFLGQQSFEDMMAIKARIDAEWGRIVEILERAGREKRGNPNFSIKVESPPDFQTYLGQALEALDFSSLGVTVNSIDAYHAALGRLEDFFFMPASDFDYLIKTAAQAQEADRENRRYPDAQWAPVYSILADAHVEKVFADRGRALQTIKQQPTDNETVINAMAKRALGDVYREQSSLSALNQLEPYVPDAGDFAYLQDSLAGDPVWEKVYGIFVAAWRNREGLDPVPYREQWQNLYSAQDATAVAVERGIPEDIDSPRWETFGRAVIDVAEGSDPPESFGWAVSSPLLLLAQGTRTITVTLTFADEKTDWNTIKTLLETDPRPFEIKLSGEKEWLSPSLPVTPEVGKGGAPQTLKFEAVFEGDVDPSSPPGVYTPVGSVWPVLAITLKQIWQETDRIALRGRFITHYQPFKNLSLSRVEITTNVNGLTDFYIANDEAVLDPKSPFEPFGSHPLTGSRFYVGHRELIVKKLDSLTFRPEWMGAPADLKAHYENYGASLEDDGFTLEEGSFKADVAMIDTRTGKPLFEAKKDLLSSETKIESIGSYKVATGIDVGEADPKTWQRYIRWKLDKPDFQHTAYPNVANKKALELAAILSGKSAKPADFAPENYAVNPPYTPKLKSLTLDYDASVSIELGAEQESRGTERFFHIHPFGYREIGAGMKGSNEFLPRYDHEGELYIGIENLRPPQNLNLLMQMAEGSADPDLEQASVQWSYLSANRWISLGEGHILSDSSRGLINSGIIAFKLPVADPNTLLPGNIYWLRAAVARNSQSVCDSVAIQAQAVAAVFVDRDNADDHLSQPLPPARIKRLADPVPQIKAIHQPYSSYGGKVAEQDAMFHTRVSERLRHKHRALSAWDYERLILERFPQIHKAKCLPAALNGGEDEPGTVAIVVVPDIRERFPFDPFEPKAPADLIKDIETYLADISSDWAVIRVKNPHYVSVKARFAVRLLAGYDEGYYMHLLNQELNRFLAPWAYAEGADIVIGGRIYANSLIDFIDKQPYVDYVTDLKLFSSDNGVDFTEAPPSRDDGHWVGAGERADTVLVPARQHEIDMVPDTGYQKELFTGINYMKIELDFVVA